LGKTLTGSYAYYQLTNPSLDPVTMASTGVVAILANHPILAAADLFFVS
jgi:hypothetical protein